MNKIKWSGSLDYSNNNHYPILSVAIEDEDFGILLQALEGVWVLNYMQLSAGLIGRFNCHSLLTECSMEQVDL